MEGLGALPQVVLPILYLGSEISTLKAMPFDEDTIFGGSQFNMNELPLEKTQ